MATGPEIEVGEVADVPPSGADAAGAGEVSGEGEVDVVAGSDAGGAASVVVGVAGVSVVAGAAAAAVVAAVADGVAVAVVVRDVGVVVVARVVRAVAAAVGLLLSAAGYAETRDGSGSLWYLLGVAGLAGAAWLLAPERPEGKG